ncbi:MAG: hypothetical protein WEA58_13215 [Balneolaceae bacterium]
MSIRIAKVFIIIVLTMLISQDAFSQDVNDFTKHLKDIVEKRESVQYAEMAEKSIDEGDLGMAIEYLNKAIDTLPSAGFYIKRGRLKAELNDLDGAIQDFTFAIELSPHYDHDKESLTYQFALQADIEAYVLRGHVNTLANKHIEAISDYSKAINLEPENPMNFYFRGHAYYTIAKYEEACNDFNEVSANKLSEKNGVVIPDVIQEICR